MSRSIQEEPFQDEIATVDNDRTGIKVETLKQAILENLRYVVAEDTGTATEMDYFLAVASRYPPRAKRHRERGT